MKFFKFKYFYHFIQILLLFIVIVSVFIYYKDFNIKASDITNRSISIGSSTPSAFTNHIFTYTLLGGNDIGSIKFQYCSNSPIHSSICTPPEGLDVSSATLTSMSGEINFTFNNILSNQNTIVLSRVIPTMSVPGVSSYRFDNITNPSFSNNSYYVRISTYSSIDVSGYIQDKGSVVFSINDKLNFSAYVPPYLTFCSSQNLGDNCSTTNQVNFNLGILSSTNPSVITSQISGSTNSINGYSVYVVGNTMTSGNNVIEPLSELDISIPGRNQFGINLRSNTQPSIGNDSIGNGTLIPYGEYSIPNKFKFNSFDRIAKSVLPTDFNILTVSYLINSSDILPAGIYTTTLTFLATSTF